MTDHQRLLAALLNEGAAEIDGALDAPAVMHVLYRFGLADGWTSPSEPDRLIA